MPLRLFDSKIKNKILSCLMISLYAIIQLGGKMPHEIGE